MNVRTTLKTSLVVTWFLAITLSVASDAGAGPIMRPGGPPPPGVRPGPPPPGGSPERGGPERALYREERFIVHLYRGFLNRQPSPGEVRSWSEKMGAGASPGDLVRFFMDSDEFFIRQIYRGLLGREPDPSGMNTFTRAIQSGQNRASAVEAVIRSEEFRNRMR